jgi:hypothetical protein
MHEIILHHYPQSPYSEKVRLTFGLKGLSWRAVEQPSIMPKPELLPLTGAYRKIPVMQIAPTSATRSASCASSSDATRRRRCSGKSEALAGRCVLVRSRAVERRSGGDLRADGRSGAQGFIEDRSS